jgi:hypothetical protein
LLRYTGETDATVWVETDAACTVEVLGCTAQTFCVHGHHYALVHLEGLEKGSSTPYEVLLDGEKVWPLPDSPFGPSVIRTPVAGAPTMIAFGSCRVCTPNEPPYTLRKDEDPQGREVDALRALAMRMAGVTHEEWPHLLLMLGDQVYADEVPPQLWDFIESRRDPAVPPGETIADFEEYTRLYRTAWSEPHIRWLLSTVPTAMIFDDHDIIDDWNTSATWVRRTRGTGWWDDRIVGGLMSYWIYQHIGNLAPARLDEQEQWQHVQREADDAAPVLREFAAIARKQAPPTTVKPGQFRYTKSIQAYTSGGKTRDGRPWTALGPRVRETWFGPTGGLLHEVSSKPQFLSAADRRNWIAAGRPEVNPKEATEKIPPPAPLNLPTDPDALYRVIHDRAVGHGSGTNPEMFTLVGDTLRESDASPALRAALYEVAARIPGVELVGPATDRIGRHGVAVAYSESADHQRHRLIFDRKTAALLEEDYVELKGSFYGYPPGTVTGYATYVTSAVVDRLGARP